MKTYTCEKPHIVISITGGNNFVELPENKNRKGLLRLSFGDIDFAEAGQNRFGNIQAQQIIDFVKEYYNSIDVIICHCEAGISRSAAVAGALAKRINGDDDYYFKFHNPNMHVYSILLKKLIDIEF